MRQAVAQKGCRSGRRAILHKVLSISYFPPRAIVGFLPARGGGDPCMAVFSRPSVRGASRSALLPLAEENRATV